MDGSKKVIHKLTDDNYYTWSYDIEMLLASKGLSQHCFPLAKEDEALVRDQTWIINDKKATALIGLNVDDKFIPIIRRCHSTHEIWTELRKQFNGNTAGSILRLKTQFYQAVMEEDETLTSYLDLQKI